MVIQCGFIYAKLNHGDVDYSCFIESKQTPENRDLELAGKHIIKNNNRDVCSVRFYNCTITKIPQGLTNIFPNLTSICLLSSKLKKISKSDLVEYKNIKTFICQDNEIEFLPGDLFEGFENLEHVTFYGNMLKVVEPNILDGLTNLKHVNFKNNLNYNLCYSVHQVYEPNATLDEIKKDIYEKFFARFKILQDLRASERNFKRENVELKALVEDYKNQVDVLREREACQQNIADEMIDSLKEKIERLEVKSLIDKKFNDESKSSLTTDINTFIHDVSTKDFKITIEGQEFPVHKFLLAARSSTLAEILKNNPVVENFNLVDISVEIFEIISKFLYTDELPVEDGTNFLHLFAAAGKLKIEKLVKYAATNILDQINPENALTIFNISASFGLYDLEQKSFREIKKKYKSIKFKDEWIKTPEKVINIINKFKKKEEALKDFEEELE